MTNVPNAGERLNGQTGLADRLLHSIKLASSGDLTGAEQTVRALLTEQNYYLPARLHLSRVLLALQRPAEAAVELDQLLDGRTLTIPEELQVTLLAAEVSLRLGQLPKAEARGRRVIALAPHNSSAMFIVAMVCQQTNRTAEALELLQVGLRLEPGAAHGWVNKGLVEKQLGRLDEAITSFKHALDINPVIPPAYYSLGLTYLLRGEHDAAEQALSKCIELTPRHTDAAIQLATLLRYKNRLDEASVIYRDILKYAPDNAMARFFLDLFTRKHGPDRIPPEVVRSIYADESVGRNLEASLDRHLQYRTPSILREALQDMYGSETPVLDILDLGCGSGLYGSLVKPRAKQLVGVDLSTAMIEECRRKGVYDELKGQDIVDYLATSNSEFDLIVAMDVLCYFGDLSLLFKMCARTLRPSGVLACSVELNPDGQPWQLHRYGHFLHSFEHLREAAKNAGLRELRITENVLRRELGEDRLGYVSLFVLPDN